MTTFSEIVVLLEFIENQEIQENARKINRAEALAASGTVENHRKSFKFLPNLDLGEPRPLKTFKILTQGVGAPKT